MTSKIPTGIFIFYYSFSVHFIQQVQYLDMKCIEVVEVIMNIELLFRLVLSIFGLHIKQDVTLRENLHFKFDFLFIYIFL